MRFLALLLALCTIARGGEVTAPPPDLKAPPFYKKYISAGGYPILASDQVNDYALKEAP